MLIWNVESSSCYPDHKVLHLGGDQFPIRISHVNALTRSCIYVPSASVPHDATRVILKYVVGPLEAHETKERRSLQVSHSDAKSPFKEKICRERETHVKLKNSSNDGDDNNDDDNDDDDAQVRYNASQSFICVGLIYSI